MNCQKLCFECLIIVLRVCVSVPVHRFCMCGFAIHCNRNVFGLRLRERMKNWNVVGQNLILNGALINNELDFLGLSNATALTAGLHARQIRVPISVARARARTHISSFCPISIHRSRHACAFFFPVRASFNRSGCFSLCCTRERYEEIAVRDPRDQDEFRFTLKGINQNE